MASLVCLVLVLSVSALGAWHSHRVRADLVSLVEIEQWAVGMGALVVQPEAASLDQEWQRGASLVSRGGTAVKTSFTAAEQAYGEWLRGNSAAALREALLALRQQANRSTQLMRERLDLTRRVEFALVAVLSLLIAYCTWRFLTLFARLRRTHLLLDTVLRHVPAGIMVTSGAELRVELLNPVLQGQARVDDEVIGLPLEEAPAGCMLPRWTKLLDHVRASRMSVVQRDLSIHIEDGERPNWVNAYHLPLPEEHFRSGGVITFTLNTTREVEARRALQQKVAELAATIDSITDLVWVVDRSLRVVNVNQAWLDLAQMDRRSLPVPLANVVELFNPRRLDGSPFSFDDLPPVRTLRTGQVVNEEVVVDHPDSERYLQATAAPVRDKRGNVVLALCIHRDVTEQKRLEAMRDQFLTMAAHELRTPMTSLLGFVQFLQRRLEKDAAAGDKAAGDYLVIARRAMQQGTRLSSLVNGLLDVNRLAQGRLQLQCAPLDLSQLAARVVEQHAHIESHQIEVKAASAEPVWVNGDAVRLEQVLTNLLHNAVKYSPAGSLVQVEVGQRGDEAWLSVQDAGIGIPADELDRVFHRFYRARNTANYHAQGFGLGLFISCEIVELHGGRLVVDSEEGKGSTFTVFVPLAARLRFTRSPAVQGMGTLAQNSIGQF